MVKRRFVDSQIIDTRATALNKNGLLTKDSFSPYFL